MTKHRCQNCPPSLSRPIFLHQGKLYCVFHLPVRELSLLSQAAMLRLQAKDLREEMQQRRRERAALREKENGR